MKEEDPYYDLLIDEATKNANRYFEENTRDGMEVSYKDVRDAFYDGAMWYKYNMSREDLLDIFEICQLRPSDEQLNYILEQLKNKRYE